MSSASGSRRGHASSETAAGHVGVDAEAGAGAGTETGAGAGARDAEAEQRRQWEEEADRWVEQILNPPDSLQAMMLVRVKESKPSRTNPRSAVRSTTSTADEEEADRWLQQVLKPQSAGRSSQRPRDGVQLPAGEARPRAGGPDTPAPSRPHVPAALPNRGRGVVQFSPDPPRAPAASPSRRRTPDATPSYHQRAPAVSPSHGVRTRPSRCGDLKFGPAAAAFPIRGARSRAPRHESVGEGADRKRGPVREPFVGMPLEPMPRRGGTDFL